VVFDAADWRSPEEPEEGGRLYEVTPTREGRLELGFANGALRRDRIRRGDLVWRTDDPDLARVVRPYTEAAAPLARQSVCVCVKAAEGAPLSAEWRLARRPDVSVTVTSDGAIEHAVNRSLTEEAVRAQFARLGGTPYELAEVTLEVSGSPFVPASLLNQLRREAVEQLQVLQARPRTLTVYPVEIPLRVVREVQPGPVELHLLVREAEQLEAAIEARPASITLDYLDLYGLRPSVERVKAAGVTARVASPRLLKPGEARILDSLLSLDCPILVRSAGLLRILGGREHPPLIGDFSLNAANSLAAESYFALGVERLTPTYDLNAAQVAELAALAGAERIEAVAYQHLPVFHTEHCVFCRFLSSGHDYRDCGRPCEKHRVALCDASGRAHPVLADVGCRNTVFGAEAQVAGIHLGTWRKAGIRHFRLEFVHESAEQVRALAETFREVLSGGLTPAQLLADLKRIAPAGTTEGSYFVPEGYRALPVLG
jgi:U32 family peptidase